MPSKIEWTDETWNPMTGCTPISPGCEHCYAKRMANRLKGRCGYPSDDPFRVTLHPDRLEKPLRMRKGKRIFVDSMGDLFHPDVPDEFIAAVFGVMAACPQHTFQVLTKRAERMALWFDNPISLLDTTEEAAASAAERITDVIWDARGTDRWKYNGPPPENLAKRRPWPGWPLPNVWLGVTAEDQQRADERLVRRIPAAVWFVSVEPMLSPIWIDQYYMMDIDWVICGAETGPGARPMDLAWARDLRDQCQAAGVPFFFKKVGQGIETPPDLDIHEFPEVRHG